MSEPKKGMTAAEAIKVQEGIAALMEQRRDERRKREREELMTEPESKKLISWHEALEQEKVTYARLEAEIEEGRGIEAEYWAHLCKSEKEPKPLSLWGMPVVERDFAPEELVLLVTPWAKRVQLVIEQVESDTPDVARYIAKVKVADE